MDLLDVWPLFRLELRTPRLTLRTLRDEDIAGLVSGAIAGIHPRDEMPFAVPWSEAPPRELARSAAQHYWSARAATTPDAWVLHLVVLLDGRPIGVQDLRATSFATTRTISSGSWLTRTEQGKGYGTEMRAAMLIFAFDHLGAEVAESGAYEWNARSLAVSRRLGYRHNGRSRRAPRPGEVVEEVLLRLDRDDFVRPEWELEVRGAEEARRELIGE